MMKSYWYLLILVLVSGGCNQKNSPKKKASELSNKAVELIAAQKPDSALMCLDSVERLDSTAHVEVYKLRTTVYLAQKRYPEALKSVQKLILLQPGVPEDMTTAGTLQDVLNDSVAAQQSYERALAMYNDLLAHTYNQQKLLSIKVNIIYLLMLSGQREKALQQLELIKTDSRLSPETIARMKNYTRTGLLNLFKQAR